MERTTVTLPKALVQEAVRVIRAKSQTEAVITALKDTLRWRKIAALKRAAGTLQFDAETAKRRHRDKRLG